MNASASIYSEYVFRTNMAKLGFTSPLSELDCFTADCFAIIIDEQVKQEQKESKKASKKAPGRRK